MKLRSVMPVLFPQDMFDMFPMVHIFADRYQEQRVKMTNDTESSYPGHSLPILEEMTIFFWC